VPSATPAFYFDLASPLAYLAAEQALSVFADAGQPVEWQPVSASALPGGESFEADRCATEAGVFRAEVERRAAELGLQPLRWPEPFPFDSSMAMRVATYAKSIGRAVPFAQAAFRQAFAGGRALDDEDSVLIAAAACEMHPAAVLRATQMRSVAEQLVVASEQAARAGVRDVPAVLVGEHVFHGERALGDAASALSAHAEGAATPTTPIKKDPGSQQPGRLTIHHSR
jgi:2-hydroxychromene-2-carboxylate isomerase